MLDNIWALVLPGTIPIFSVILLLNFFREIPKEFSEAAFIDGAGHWNNWFDGLILINDFNKYPFLHKFFVKGIVLGGAKG